jgi:hypothetical protein
MRTILPVGAVIALGLVLLLFTGSGFNALVTGDANTNSLQDQLQDTSNETNVDDSTVVEGSRETSGDGSIVGIAIGGASRLLGIVGLVALLPRTLQQLGFPAWFAVPLGSVASLIAAVGIIQFIAGRIWR